MNEKEIDKTVRSYTRLFVNAMRNSDFNDIDSQAKRYSEMLREMYLSDQYKDHNQYPTMSVDRIYAVIAMCLILKDKQYNKEDIIAFVNDAFQQTTRAVRRLMKVIDIFPWTYKIAEKWNINDHEKRVKDGSISYDYFKVEDGTIEYCISKCMYVEIFDSYGIRELCKIFCNTDINAYTNLTKHVCFTRYSDLSDGNCCHDLITRKNRCLM